MGTRGGTNLATFRSSVTIVTQAGPAAGATLRRLHERLCKDIEVSVGIHHHGNLDCGKEEKMSSLFCH
jgi:hypothetical protein